jgi:two-component system response regulator YesN
VVTSVEQHFSALRKESGFSTLLAGDWKTISDLETMEEIEDYVRDVCRTILARMEEKDRDRNLNVVRKMIEIIDQSFHKPLTVEQISKEVFLSPNYIRSLFKEKTGETVLEYLTRKRILHAEELLHDKSLKIHEIAAASGYENVSYFCSVFQKYKGITPNEYRKKLL